MAEISTADIYKARQLTPKLWIDKQLCPFTDWPASTFEFAQPEAQAKPLRSVMESCSHSRSDYHADRSSRGPGDGLKEETRGQTRCHVTTCRGCDQMEK